MTENMKKHVIRKHNVESIDFRFHNYSKQTKLCFTTKDLNSNQHRPRKTRETLMIIILLRKLLNLIFLQKMLKSFLSVLRMRT